MKTLKNKTTEIDGTFEDEKDPTKTVNRKTTYVDLMKIVMNQIPREGARTSEMRKDFRVIDALEKANHNIQLEDSDFEHFNTKLKNMAWGFRHRALLGFEEDIEQAAKGEEEAKKPEKSKSK